MYLKFVSPTIIDLISKAYSKAYEVNSLEPKLGHTRFSYGVNVFESALFYLESLLKPLGGVVIKRRGNSFLVILGACTLRFYSDLHNNARSFKLNGKKSRTRQRVLTNNLQVALFANNPAHDVDPTIVPDLIIIHSGEPNQGLTSLHIGMILETSDNAEAWMWCEPLTLPNRFDLSISASKPSVAAVAFNEIIPPEVNVKPLRKADDGNSVSGLE